MSLKFLKYLVIVTLCLVSYGDKLDGDFVFDDSVAVVKNKIVSRSNGNQSWTRDLFTHDFWGTPILSKSSHKSFRPLTTLTFRLEFQYHGKESSPFWMKLTNLGLHVLVSCFLLEFGDLFIRDRCKTSFLAAILFAVHPIHTEAVSGIVSRADLLATLCCMLIIWVYFKTFIAREYQKTFSVVAIVFLFIAGMLFKETVCTVLATCAALEIIYNTSIIQGILSIQNFKEVPWRRISALGAASIICLFLRAFTGTPDFHLKDNPIAVIEDPIFRTINQVFLHAINAWLLICPDWLSFDWSMGSVEIISTWTDLRLIAVVLHLAILLSFYLILIHTNEDRRKRLQLASCAVLTIIPFLPASGIIHVGFVIAERLLYLPSIGWCILVALGFQKLLRRVSNQNMKYALKLCFIFVIGIFLMKTRSQATEWLHEESLYISGLRVCPNNAKVHYNIGNVLKNDPIRAIASYRQAIQLYPEYEAALMNLGNLYRDRGNLNMAEHFLRKALENISIPDKRAAAEMNLGIVMVMRKEFATALDHYHKALKDRPYYPVCYFNMGNAYVELRQFDLAQKSFETALSLDMTLAVAWKNLLTLLYNEGKYELVIDIANEALGILPTEVELQFPKANALAKLKRNIEAEQVFLSLIERRPNDAVYYANLGVLYHHWKRYEKSSIFYERALALNPSLDRIRVALEKVKRLQLQYNQMQ